MNRDKKIDHYQANFFSHEIEVFCDEFLNETIEPQEKINGLMLCLFNSDVCCCSSCPLQITSSPQRGNPFHFTKKLGQGGYSSIFEGIWDQQAVAFKVIPVERDGKQFTTKSNGPYELFIQVIISPQSFLTIDNSHE